jgi:hypothetical protein
MKWGLRKGPILVIAAVILAVGLGVILSSFFREVAPRFTGDLEPLLRAGVALFFIGAVYFLVALVSLTTVKPPTEDEDALEARDGMDTRITFDLKDPATHVASSILILVGAAVLLTISFARPPDQPATRSTATQTPRASEGTMESRIAEASADPLAYYARRGIVTDPGPHADLLDQLPDEVGPLVTTLQGLLLHVYWAEAHGVTLTEERRKEVGIRSVRDMLARIRELDDRPLAEPRDLDRRLVANCRDYAVLLTAALRHRGVPARARSGFGTYFAPGEYMDHWVCEYWNDDDGRWVMVDAQIDELQTSTLAITFDPLDMPEGLFVTGGDAWLMCRAGDADPERFGIMDLHGMSFVRGNVGHDFWALNRVETLPWEGWGVPWKEEDDVTEEDLAFLDEVSRLMRESDASFAALRALHEDDPRLRVPEGWPSD